MSRLILATACAALLAGAARAEDTVTLSCTATTDCASAFALVTQRMHPVFCDQVAVHRQRPDQPQTLLPMNEFHRVGSRAWIAPPRARGPHDRGHRRYCLEVFLIDVTQLVRIRWLGA